MPANDVARLSDSRFFERHPERQHRVRRASLAEIQQLECAAGSPMQLPPGYRLDVIVCSITSNYCARQFIPIEIDAETNVDEDLAAALFECLAAGR